MAKPEDVPAHSAAQTHHYTVHFPEHPARTSDPHYVDFHHYHEQHRKTARCYVGQRIGYSDCRDAQGVPTPAPEDATAEQDGLELHHAFVEFSLQNGIDLKALEVDFPGISDPTKLGEWVESDQNFRWLCVLPDTLVLMANGTELPIQYVQPGDMVLGKDGNAYPVTAVGRRQFRGAVVQLSPGLTLTEDHQVLTEEGWLPAGQIMNQFGMLGNNMRSLRGIENEILRPIVGAVPIDMMHPLRIQQLTANNMFHNQPMLHNQTLAIPDTTISFRSNMRSSIAQIPFGQAIEVCKTAGIGAITTGLGSPIRSTLVLNATDFTDEHRSLTWLAINKPIRSLYTGWVHDISIAHSHSFIGGGIVVHNCVYHHRGPGGAHTASHSDWSGGLYVEGLISATDQPPKTTT